MINIILPVSRLFYLKEVFTSLEFLDVTNLNVSLLVYVDGNEMLYEATRRYVVNSKFANKICLFRGKGQANASSIRRRRQRIADIHNEIKEEIKQCDYVFLLEDDTLIPPQTLQKMNSLYTMYPHAGLVTGVEVGRWGFLHLGLFEVDDIYNVKKITSTTLKEGVQKIDTSGFYCMMTKWEYFQKHTFKVYDDILGPDFDYGLSLRQAGLLNYCDYNIRCTHMTQKENIKVTDTIIQVQFNKLDKWNQRII